MAERHCTSETWSLWRCCVIAATSGQENTHWPTCNAPSDELGASSDHLCSPLHCLCRCDVVRGGRCAGTVRSTAHLHNYYNPHLYQAAITSFKANLNIFTYGVQANREKDYGGRLWSAVVPKHYNCSAKCAKTWEACQSTFFWQSVEFKTKRAVAAASQHAWIWGNDLHMCGWKALPLILTLSPLPELLSAFAFSDQNKRCNQSPDE